MQRLQTSRNPIQKYNIYFVSGRLQINGTSFARQRALETNEEVLGGVRFFLRARGQYLSDLVVVAGMTVLEDILTHQIDLQTNESAIKAFETAMKQCRVKPSLDGHPRDLVRVSAQENCCDRYD